MTRAEPAAFRGAFTLIEVLLVVAIIGILSALVVAGIANASSDAKLVLARQQQAVIQEALNAWIASTTLSAASNAYNGQNTAAGKIGLFKAYIDTNARWFSEGLEYNGASLQTANMKSINQTLTFSTWTNGTYPTVGLQPVGN